MQKLALVSIISSISTTIAAPAFAASMTCNVAGGTNNGVVYTTVATSNGISVVHANPNATIATYYVNNTEPAGSDPWTPTPPPPNPYNLSVSGDWCIDQTSGAFTGKILYGNYKTQTNWTGIPAIDGRQTYTGVEQNFSGTGTWGTNGGGFPTLSFNYLSTTVNGGGASTQIQTAASCSNGTTSLFGKVCTLFASTSKNWEGLNFLFTFTTNKYSFTGQLTGTDTSGTGLTRNTTSIIWNLAGTDPPAEVPVPAAAWLFGSGLIGLAGAARRRSGRRTVVR